MHRDLASVMAEVRDPEGFAHLHQLAESGPTSSRKDAQIAATRIATLLACKGGAIRDITDGEVEGLRVSLAGAEERLGQINRRAQTAPTGLGMPTTRSTDRE
ncbi:hypothetical protein ACWDSD_42590 [Streptomyces spiralis]